MERAHRPSGPAIRGEAPRKPAAFNQNELKIVKNQEDPFKEPTYDVYRGNQRLAWGLQDQSAATRWARRLAQQSPGVTQVEGEAPQQGGEGFRPNRVWWNGS